ncbi:DUF423 domain-containing protein [Methylomonas koyamae]|uniref:DUF423 domain-containing protein n=1 Tax=Methylomonas koyamae TaxID=702114 RepID=UPI00112EAEBF|nr:DUF423 domain-containing protein [Methylomonas koyamae]TPQ24722.1 DUF423 domain-containing protein [Methylomonas koyamae]
MRRTFLFLAAVGGFSGVALGAFGAHGLKHLLSDYQLDIYKTAVNYQMWHSLALALAALLPERAALRWAGRLFALGILLFSGSLYLLAIFDIKWLGMVTPLGGLAFLAGWGLLAYVALRE